MARLFLALFFVTLCSSFVDAQEQINYLERLLRQERFEDLSEILDSVQGSHPSIEFIRGLLQQDAHLAITHFRQVVRHPDSPYADDAQFRIAQYHYARGDYQRAKEHFSKLASAWPQSNLFDDSIFLYGQCLVAEEKIDSARIVYESFIQKFPKSTYADQAVMDLESPLFHKSVSPTTLAPHDKTYYTIQVGAFGELNNAQRIARQLRDDNLPVEIYARNSEGERLYIVWVGKFASRELAERSARRWDTKFVDGYHIVTVENN